MSEEKTRYKIRRLFERRLVFVMGKGGAGKTTLSMALAFAAEEAGKRVLLAETDDSEGIGRFFGVADLAEKPVPVSRGISIARVLPQVEMAEYAQFHIKPRFVAKQVTGSRLFGYLFGAAPGLKEIMTLGRLWRWESARRNDGRPFYDVVIVDTPVAGHALNLLRLPEKLLDMIRAGPIASQVKTLQSLLKDQNRTALVMVSRPEALPVKESLGLAEIARKELEIPVAMFFLNGVYPEVFPPPYPRFPDDIPGKTIPGFVLEASGHQHSWRMAHERELGIARQAAVCPVVEIPYYFADDMTVRHIRQIASDWSSPEEPEQEGPDV